MNGDSFSGAQHLGRGQKLVFRQYSIKTLLWTTTVLAVVCSVLQDAPELLLVLAGFVAAYQFIVMPILVAWCIMVAPVKDQHLDLDKYPRIKKLALLWPLSFLYWPITFIAAAIFLAVE